MINTFNIIGFIIIIIVVIIIETIQIYSCILLQIIICLVCFQEDTCNEGKVMWPFKQYCFLLFPFIFWTTNALSIWRKVAHPSNRATLYSCVYNCDDLLSYNSSPRSSHIWFSYIHNFRATLYEPTFLTFPYKTWQKVGWTKRLAQLGRYVMIHVGHCPIKHSQLFPIFSLHNSPLWSTHRGQLGQGKTNRARTKAILNNKSMHECCWLRQRGQHWFS